jgi:hypothetical protein
VVRGESFVEKRFLLGDTNSIIGLCIEWDYVLNCGTRLSNV